MFRGLLLYFCYFIFLTTTFSQTGKELEISILTCSSGEEIYTTFGHTAIRVKDVKANKDWVLDFGTFDFNTPFFLWKFLRGDLKYRLAVRDFDRFLNSYRRDGRAVIEERLNISDGHKWWLYQQLIENYRPENRYYKYDFLFDNCSTRIRDLIYQLPLGSLNQQAFVKDSFRDNLHLYLTNKKWLQLGIDLLLGASTDQQMTAYEQAFLPNQLSSHLKTIHYNGSNKLLFPPKKLLLKASSEQNKNSYFSPVVVLSILLFIMLFLILWKPVLTQKVMWWFYLIFGLIGLFLLFMWIGTSHPTSKLNWNILWANPLYFSLLIPRIRRLNNVLLIKIVIAWNILFLFLWSIIPQQLNLAIIPLIIGMILLHVNSTVRLHFLASNNR